METLELREMRFPLVSQLCPTPGHSEAPLGSLSQKERQRVTVQGAVIIPGHQQIGLCKNTGRWEDCV